MPTGGAARAAGCAVQARLREPLHATVPERAKSWLLIEHPGPWPSDGHPADVPAAAVAALDTAKDAGVLPQLVRRVRDRRRDVSKIVLGAADHFLPQHTGIAGVDGIRPLACTPTPSGATAGTAASASPLRRGSRGCWSSVLSSSPSCSG